MAKSVDINPPHHRIESIDLLRGAVMVIMALDHVREFFHFDAFIFSPTDLAHTTPALFATRWLTHLCAPTFILLAGTSAFFLTQRKTLKETSFFLLTRGLWLILLQLTLIRFAWHFDPLFHYNSNTIISVIGFCMITLGLLIHLPMRIILLISISMIAVHNALDIISFEHGTAADVFWSFLHVPNTYSLGNGYAFGFVYPLIPWTAVMALGYCLGDLYSVKYTTEKRKKIMLGLGLMCLFIFGVLRYSNVYGDPGPWMKHQEISRTIMSFFNLAKYPPSLLYLSATLGVAFMLLAVMEGKRVGRLKPITLFGKVAMFYYVLHVYVIHALALLAVILTGHLWQTMIFYDSVTKGSELLKGSFGFSLGQVYLIWAFVVLLLYPLCVFWNSFKMRNKNKWWISYV